MGNLKKCLARGKRRDCGQLAEGKGRCRQAACRSIVVQTAPLRSTGQGAPESDGGSGKLFSDEFGLLSERHFLSELRVLHFGLQFPQIHPQLDPNEYRVDKVNIRRHAPTNKTAAK